MIVGVSEKDVAGSRYLRIEQRSEKEDAKATPVMARIRLDCLIGSSVQTPTSYKQLEPEDNAGRQAQIILSRAEEFRMNPISFNAQGDGVKNAIVQAAAYRSRERGIRRPGQGSARMNMRRADKDLAKWSEFADGNSESRADEVFLLMSGHADVQRTIGGEFCKALRAVVTAHVAHDTYKWENLSFKGAFPTMKVGPAHGRTDKIRAESSRVRTFVRESEEHISRWYLCVRQSREKK